MGALYLIFGFVYPIYISLVIYSENPPQKLDIVFNSDEAKFINVPLMVIFGLHFLLMLPSLILEFSRKSEALLILCLVATFYIEMTRDQDWKLPFSERASVEHNDLALGVQLTAWIAGYIMFFRA